MFFDYDIGHEPAMSAISVWKTMAADESMLDAQGTFSGTESVCFMTKFYVVHQHADLCSYLPFVHTHVLIGIMEFPCPSPGIAIHSLSMARMNSSVKTVPTWGERV